MPPASEPDRSSPAAQGAIYLVEWWTAGDGTTERDGSWAELDSAAEALDRALVQVDAAWTSRVRITILVGGANTAAVSTGRAELETWRTVRSPLPDEAPGPILPPRSPDDIRGEVIDGCRDALALALRAGLIGRDRVLTLLLEIDKSFDPGMLDADDPDV